MNIEYSFNLSQMSFVAHGRVSGKRRRSLLGIQIWLQIRTSRFPVNKKKHTRGIN